MATRQVFWPRYNVTPTETKRLELTASSIEIMRHQLVVQAQFSNQELTFNMTPGEWAGSITIHQKKRNSDGHVKARILIEDMLSDPANNWTLVPWFNHSIFILNSTLIDGSTNHRAITRSDNNQIASLLSSANGVARILVPGGQGEQVRPSAGEHFGYGGRTYKILTATQIGNTRNWNLTTTPSIPNTTTAGNIYKRTFMPMRFRGGQNVADSATGSFAGPWAISVIEMQNVD